MFDMFSNNLPIASVTNVHKKDEPTDRENFITVSGLSLYLLNRDLLKLYRLAFLLLNSKIIEWKRKV